ncbi:uncharacterized protein LOC141649441 [Silene latifolia]|uniref:uncharacterized protein LOC141649441 n=1 Tax=Silene latifolia TaxID=37657 RepID=UPI003D785A30
MWSKSSSFLIKVQEEWNKHYEGHKMFSVVKKLKALKFPLKSLNRDCFADIETSANIAESDLLAIQNQLAQDPQNADLITREIETATKWLEAGDSNTAYFHASIKKRNSLNKVTKIDDQYGRTCTDSQSIQNAFLDYYQTLLGTQKPTERVRHQVIAEGQYCNQDHAAILSTAVSDEEIKAVFFSIPIDKSPGPDGYTSAFFKDSWDIVGGEVCAAIKDFFSTGQLLKQINATNITLIPKCDRPSSVKQFRPIACCNMIYKVISKLLCNRLAQVLPDLISENQGAFIKGRSIIENVLICQDLVKMYNRKAVSPRCLFKIDLQKAYDTVEWDFVEQLFRGFQFPEAFIQRGDTQSIVLLLRAFSSFSKASRLTMNNSKSEVYYNGVAQQVKDDIHQFARFEEGTMPFRYLGVPIQAGRLTKKECNILTERMVGFFLIPKSVIKRIEAICKNFLWDGSSEYHKVPLVAWETVTLPKNEGGLGIKRALTWNYATIGKLVDWVYTKSDRLWIKWVHQLYIKDKDWHNYSPPSDAAWAWKNICKIKEMMKNGYVANTWILNTKGYTVSSGYEWLRHKQPQQHWAPMIWSNWNIPKHAIITWISMHKGLKVKEKLFRLGCFTDDRCIICDREQPSTATVGTVVWLQNTCQYAWRIAKCQNRLKQQVHYLLWNALYYHVWSQRNAARIQSVLIRPQKLAEMIKDEDVKLVVNLMLYLCSIRDGLVVET